MRYKVSGFKDEVLESLKEKSKHNIRCESAKNLIRDELKNLPNDRKVSVTITNKAVSIVVKEKCEK